MSLKKIVIIGPSDVSNTDVCDWKSKRLVDEDNTVYYPVYTSGLLNEIISSGTPVILIHPENFEFFVDIEWFINYSKNDNDAIDSFKNEKQRVLDCVEKYNIWTTQN